MTLKLKTMRHYEKDELIQTMAALLDAWVDIEREVHFEDTQAHDVPNCNFCETMECLKDIGYYTEKGEVQR